MKRILILLVLLLAMTTSASAWMYKSPTALLDDSTGTTLIPLAVAAGAIETTTVVDIRNTDLTKIQFGIWCGTSDSGTVKFSLFGGMFPTLDSTLSWELIDSASVIEPVTRTTYLWEPRKVVPTGMIGIYPAADTVTGIHITGNKRINYPYLHMKITRSGAGVAATSIIYWKVFIHTKQPG